MSRAITNPDVRGRASRWRWQADLVIACAAMFIVLTTAAMLLFPGGAPFAVTSRHYLFLGNYLSDLGAKNTYSGRPNGGSRALFTVALISVGISLALFGPSWKVWTHTRRTTVVGTLATASAVLGGCFLIATALTPWDIDYYRHTEFVRIAFGLIFAFITCLSIVQISNRAPRAWIAANLLYLVALGAFAIVTFSGPPITTQDGVRLQVAAQKVIVYATVVNLSLQAWAVRRAHASEEHERPQQLDLL